MRLLGPYGFPLLLTLLGLGGCGAPFSHRESKEKTDTPERLLTALHRQRDRVRTFEGYARLTVYTEQGRFRGGLWIRAVYPDSVWMKLDGPLGMKLGLLRVTGGEVLLYSPIQKMAFKGSLSEAALLDLPFLETTADLIRLVEGLPFLDPGRLDSLTTFRVQKTEALLELGESETLWISLEGPTIHRWERRNGEGRVIALYEASLHRKVGGVLLPRMIRLTRFRPSGQITLYYDWIRTNRSFKKGWAEIPLAEEIHVQPL